MLFKVTLFVMVIELVAPVSLPIIVNCVAAIFCPAVTPTFTLTATRVLLFGASSSPKKNGVVAPTEPPPELSTVILQTDWSCNINV